MKTRITTGSFFSASAVASSLSRCISFQSTCGASLFWPVLGAVRFFLALIVAGAHMVWFDRSDRLGEQLGLFSGLAAVIGFLVLSGFSIAASLEREPTAFYFRRFKRIFPLYALAIAAALAVPAFFSDIVVTQEGSTFATPDLGTALGNLGFLQGFFCKPVESNAVVWSLSIEVLLYAIAPLFARFSSAALGTIILASLALFAAGGHYRPDFYSQLTLGAGAAMLAWAWLLGFVVYRIPDRRAGALVVFFVGVVAFTANPMFLRPRWALTLGIVSLALGFGAAIFGSRAASRILSLLGDISYPLYLFHMPVYLAMAGLRIPGSWLYIAVAVVTSVILDQFYDRPMKIMIGRIAARFSARAAAEKRAGYSSI